MEELSFMVGEWIGTSKVYENGKVTKECPAFQKITYDLDKSILVIDLNSELLQLHTIVYYNDEEKNYVYYPFSKRGVTKLPAKLEEGKLIVQANKNTRFVFGRESNGGCREYGEQFKDGKWEKYFEDTFQNAE